MLRPSLDCNLWWLQSAAFGTVEGAMTIVSLEPVATTECSIHDCRRCCDDRLTATPVEALERTACRVNESEYTRFIDRHTYTARRSLHSPGTAPEHWHTYKPPASLRTASTSPEATSWQGADGIDGLRSHCDQCHSGLTAARGRLWVPFRLLVMGVRIRLLIPIW